MYYSNEGREELAERLLPGQELRLRIFSMENWSTEILYRKICKCLTR